MLKPNLIISLFVYGVILVMSGCATHLAKPIDEEIQNIPNLLEVKNNSKDYVGTRIRWGGVIAGVHNEASDTLVEIVSRPLDGQGRPTDSDTTYGRFIAKISGFLDPVVYAAGREITVVGSILGLETRPIDKYQYQYISVNVDTFLLWPPLEENIYYYDPYWYGPWYPYYRPYYYPHRHRK
ncbi:MAG: Slp family lipoprotein [Gammaproteobacteria bacterium]|nr:Slp family lipoprotein [Gammaproteobacteria bacterium]